MKAMVLAAGFGTRLKEISLDTPKCLLEVHGKTLLEHVIERLKSAGVKAVAINLHHLADKVQQFVEDRNCFDMEICFSHEAAILGTGGGIKHAREFLKDSDYFLVHNADVYSEINLSELIATHQREQPLATLAVRSCNTVRYLLCSPQEHIVGWVNSESGNSEIISGASGEPVTFTGVHVASVEVFNYFEQYSGEFSFFAPYMQAANDGQRLQAYHIGDAYWIDVGTPERLAELRARKL